MNQYTLYSNKEIEELKQKLADYKHTLETLKNGNSTDHKAAFIDSNQKLLKSKGELRTMEDKFEKQLADYELEKKRLAMKIEQLNESLVQVKQDINHLMNKINPNKLNELLESTNTLIHNQYDYWNQERGQIELIKQEVMKLKEELKQPNETVQHYAAPKQSEYRQLQNMLQSSNYAQQTPYNNKMTTPEQQNISYVRNQSSQYTDPSYSSRNRVQRESGAGTISFQQMHPFSNRNVITSKSQRSKKKDSQHTAPASEPIENQSSFSLDVQAINETASSPKNSANRASYTNDSTINDISSNQPTSTPQVEGTNFQNSAEELQVSKKSGELPENKAPEKEQKKLEFTSFFSLFQKKV